MSIRFFLVAGEPSGDLLGAGLMRALKEKCADISFSGIGGQGMQAQGLTSLLPMDALSVIGLAGILANYRTLRGAIQQTIDAIVEQNPEAVITIDSQEFSARVMRGVKARAPHIRTIHYVVPTVWAWRPKRAARLAEIADQLLALFPFEPPYFERHGVRCDFVGHPVAMLRPPDRESLFQFRQRFGLESADPLLLVLPGSRKSEIRHHIPVLTQTLARLHKAYPTMRVVVPIAGNLSDVIREGAANWSGAPIFLDPMEHEGATFEALKYTAFGAADLALASSGTVALELAGTRTPLVVFYKLNWLSYMLALMLKKIDRICLLNIIAEKDVVPELVGRRCRADVIEAAADEILQNPAHQSAQRAAMDRVATALGQDIPPPPSHRAAAAILDGLERVHRAQ